MVAFQADFQWWRNPANCITWVLARTLSCMHPHSPAIWSESKLRSFVNESCLNVQVRIEALQMPDILAMLDCSRHGPFCPSNLNNIKTATAGAQALQQTEYSRSRSAAPPAKRACLSPHRASPSTQAAQRSIPDLLRMSEAEVWTLPKAELRKHFVTLQEYARDPHDVLGHPPPPPPPLLESRERPPLLQLPPEIRELIYAQLLSPPASPPIRGPHPRQLQTQLSLAQSFSPALLRANRQLHHEALRTFYGCQTQIVYITIDYNVWTHKLQRSPLVLGQAVTSAMRQFHVNINLGNEKKTSKPSPDDAEARLAVVRKGSRKVGKWLSGGDIKMLEISWHEPPKTYTWEQKKEILDEFKVLRAEHVKLGVLNWNLNYSGKKYQFREEYLKELQRNLDATTGSVEESNPAAR